MPVPGSELGILKNSLETRHGRQNWVVFSKIQALAPGGSKPARLNVRPQQVRLRFKKNLGTAGRG
jgi:hypothetical protein